MIFFGLYPKFIKVADQPPQQFNVVDTRYPHEWTPLIIGIIDGELANREQFVIKPAQGSGGKGILVVTGRDEERFVKSSGDQLGLDDVTHLTWLQPKRRGAKRRHDHVPRDFTNTASA